MRRILSAIVFIISFAIFPAYADPPYSSNTSGTTQNGVLQALTDIAEPLNNRWNYAAAASGISNTTTAVTIKAAAGAGIRNCINGFTLQSSTLGAATEFAIRDGAGGTVLFRTQLQTAALPLTSMALSSPICGTANTLLEVVTLTASVSGAVYFNAVGFTQ